MTARDAHLIGTYARQPVEFVRGEGARLWDAEGNEYLDFLCGISVSSVGHCHPRVVEAIRAQAGELIHVGNLFYTEPMVRLARRLAESSLGGKVFFTNSGAEAVEAALKLARRFKAGGEIVVSEGAFHGRTYGALSATPQETKQAPFAPLVPGFVTARDVAAAVGERTAAVLIEPIRGETGVHPAENLGRLDLTTHHPLDQFGLVPRPIQAAPFECLPQVGGQSHPQRRGGRPQIQLSRALPQLRTGGSCRSGR